MRKRKRFYMNVNGHKSKGRPKKLWIEYVNDDMVKKGVNIEMTSYRKV